MRSRRWHQQGDRVAVLHGMTRSLPLPSGVRAIARFILSSRWLCRNAIATGQRLKLCPILTQDSSYRRGNEIQLKRTVDEAMNVATRSNTCRPPPHRLAL